MAQMTGCTTALLKERSPSCGSGMIYDGTFSGALCEGHGVCGELLKRHGIQVLGESRVEELLSKKLSVRKAEQADAALLAELALELWPEHTLEEMTVEMADFVSQSECALFLLYSGSEPAGFAQCQLRHDYVEGTESSPVGYLEGVYVRSACRLQGGARRLLAACEDWARGIGCTEFASDCELTNEQSLSFHLRAGFQEANRIICFTKKL